MPYASAGVRELWFGASSAAPLPGFGEARPRAGGARPLSVGLLCRIRAAAGALHVTVVAIRSTDRLSVTPCCGVLSLPLSVHFQ